MECNSEGSNACTSYIRGSETAMQLLVHTFTTEYRFGYTMIKSPYTQYPKPPKNTSHYFRNHYPKKTPISPGIQRLCPAPCSSFKSQAPEQVVDLPDHTRLIAWVVQGSTARICWKFPTGRSTRQVTRIGVLMHFFRIYESGCPTRR